MVQKLSSLFFSTAKRIARLQRQAIKVASRPLVKKPRKKASKTGPARRVVAKANTTVIPTGAGTWKNLVHRTAAPMTDMLGRLAYSLYQPEVRPIAGLPLVIMLHGCQQTAHDLALGSRMNHLADTKGFMVAYPQQAKRIQAMRCWRWFKPDAAHGLAEADAIADLTRTLVKRHKLDRSRVYVAGLSAGAGMAALVAVRHPDLFAATAIHSGTVLGDAHSTAGGLQTMRRGTLGDPADLVESLVAGGTPFPGLPAIILHGERDNVVAPRNARQLSQQFVHLNWFMPHMTSGQAAALPRTAPSSKVAVLAAGTNREYLRTDFRRGTKPIVRVCMIKGIGHAWSGGDARMKFNTKDGPKACALIWQFFDMHTRSV